METRSFFLDHPEWPEQGFLSYCLDGIGRARQALDWPSRTDSAADHFLNVHLAQALVFGLHPAERTIQVLATGVTGVRDYLDQQPSRYHHHAACLMIGRSALFFHSQGLTKLDRRTGRWAGGKRWDQMLVAIGQDCYLIAWRQLPDHDLYGTIWQKISKDFRAYSQLLHQAGVDLGFTNQLPHGLIE